MIQVCSNSTSESRDLGQSEASIPANQRLEDVTKRADGGKLLCIKKRVLVALLFLSKYNFAHYIFCDHNKCSRVYWDLAQVVARHDEQELRGQRQFSETKQYLRDRDGSNSAQRLVRPDLFCSYRGA